MKRFLFSTVLVLLLVPACGGSSVEEAVTSSSAEASTTTEADEVAWSEGSTVLRIDDCFREISAAGEDATEYEVVPCDAPHKAEVVGAGVECVTQEDFLAVAAAYVGVNEDEFYAWMDENQLAGVMVLAADEGLITSEMCYLMAAGDRSLARSYRAASDG